MLEKETLHDHYFNTEKKKKCVKCMKLYYFNFFLLFIVVKCIFENVGIINFPILYITPLIPFSTVMLFTPHFVISVCIEDIDIFCRPGS